MVILGLADSRSKGWPGPEHRACVLALATLAPEWGDREVRNEKINPLGAHRNVTWPDLRVFSDAKWVELRIWITGTSTGRLRDDIFTLPDRTGPGHGQNG
ncbi:hypothetical protein NMY22_g12759 [Coprinellus aureogranulatus]|nr:hypothetical protein NMY22_g12759 [Coprinellus aureogranulatus]